MKMNPTAMAVALLCGSAVSGAALAGEYDSRVYLAPGLSYTLPDSSRDAENGGGAFFGIGKPVSEHWNIEFVARANELDLDNGSSAFNQRALMIDGLYIWNRESVLTPYGVIGAGAIRNELRGTSHNNAALNAGVGALYAIGKEGLGLRADVRYRMDLDNKSLASEDSFGDVAFNLGIVLPLGKSKSDSAAATEAQPMAAPKLAAEKTVSAPVVAVAAVEAKPVVEAKPLVEAKPVIATPTPIVAAAAAKVEPVAKSEPAPVVVAVMDGDKDGVPDNADQCANTLNGAKVDAKGCEMDSDGDKIADSRDQCANTPTGVKVGTNGCAIDADSDGVADASDACADTKAGTKVNEKGCPITTTVALNKLQFGFGNAELDDASKKTLDAVAAELKANPSQVLEVTGHADAIGSETFNQTLSEKRAQVVSAYLAKKGVTAASLRNKGFGEDKPIASNKTNTGRAQNRRVEMFVTNE